MIAELVAQRQIAKLFAAFEARDVDRLVRFWAEDIVIEFPEGTPMAGEWRGRAECTAFFKAVFAHNASISITPLQVAVRGGWSPRGATTYWLEWRVTLVGVNGHVFEASMVTVAEIRRWRTVRSRDYCFDVPGWAAHYATMEFPPRKAARGRSASSAA